MTILFTVTNDLTYDQRMQRICTSLAAHGYTVQLVGRQRSESWPLSSQPFAQKRLHCWFEKGFAFYAEYNLRLFSYLMITRYDAVCSIDLDTLAAGCFATLIRRKKRVFDAHEYFTEVPEVVNRPFVKHFWQLVARVCLPFYRYAYTVGPGLAGIFEEVYGLEFAVVRNTPVKKPPPSPPVKGGSQMEQKNDSGVRIENMVEVANNQQPQTAEWVPSPPFTGGQGGANATEATTSLFLLYQGALNAGRGLEAAIAAMQQLNNVQLWLAGEGDLSNKLRQLAIELGVENKVRFLCFVQPNDLKQLTAQAWLGLNLLENRGLSYYYSLANKFFDYVQAEVPVLTMNFPEYRALNAAYEVAVLLDELSADMVAAAIKQLQNDESLYARLQADCAQARSVWTWEQDEKTLLQVWERVQTEQ